MDRRVLELWGSELPIQLAPMGGVSVTPRLALAVAAAGGHAMYAALALPPPALMPAIDALAGARAAFGVNFIDARCSQPPRSSPSPPPGSDPAAQLNEVSPQW